MQNVEAIKEELTWQMGRPIQYAGYEITKGFKERAEYMINIPTLKAHARAGITLSAKNHFGSHTRGGADHLHNGLVSPNQGAPTRTELGMYRVQVDLMGHKMIGRNTMLVLVDGLYAGPEATFPPDKWDMAPFNGDWTSSLFASMDQVALESVCFDFLKNEYNNKSVKDSRGDSHIINFPNMAQGVDDYLEQAADPSKWPENIVYDPEDDGEPISSLGAHEHWNGTETKQYSRNLGMNVGIELVGIPAGLVAGATSSRTHKAGGNESIEFYPNPFAHHLVLKFKFDEPSVAKVDIFNIQGQLIKILAEREFLTGEQTLEWNGSGDNGSPVPEGIYMVSLDAISGNELHRELVSHRDAESGEQPEKTIRAFEMDGALPDVLSSNGKSVFMRHMQFSADDLKYQGQNGLHLYTPTGFLDDSWWHRSYWLYGHNFIAGWSGWSKVGGDLASGRIRLLRLLLIDVAVDEVVFRL